MATITIEEAQATLADLIHNLEPGEELIITENNIPLAKIIPQIPVASKRPGPGLCKGMITINADDDDHLQDFGEYRMM
ncbi:hypothetical protein IQ225_01340 [Synechocystis salina LEGE 06155]|nr:hypothetical protein [Synechocystis salina LEGE 06155]